MRALLVASGVALALLPSRSAAQTAAPKPTCNSAEHRQFDFWVGEWNVTNPDGSPAGTSRIERILDGCVIQENWTGARGMSGKSYNIYDRSRNQWHQTWVDDRGTLLGLDGTFAEGRMVLSAPGKNAAGEAILQRITWEQTGPAEVRQLWEQSADSGKSWTVVFDGRYHRKG